MAGLITVPNSWSYLKSGGHIIIVVFKGGFSWMKKLYKV